MKNGPGSLVCTGPLNSPKVWTLSALANGTIAKQNRTRTKNTVGTFNILPGDGSITISGTFGNSQVSSSAGTNVYLGSVLVGQCIEFQACYNSTVSWSDTLTAAQIASLGTGPVNLTATQTSQYVIRMGETTLDQATATPEPSSIFLFGTSLLGAGSILRRKFKG